MFCFLKQLNGVILLLVALFATIAASGCFRAQARAPVELPPLEVPPPPPRLVDTSLIEDPPPGPVLAEPPSKPAPPTTAATAPRPAPTPAGSSKPTPAAETSTPTAETRPATLQTVRPQEEGRMERAIRALVARAAADLNRVDYQKLGRDGKANYEQAKRFIGQADEALKAKNLIFAETVADKAATLAGQLAGR